MVDRAMWLITALSLLGVVLNIHKKRECFYIWAFTNAAWCIYDIWKDAVPQAVLMGIYFGLAIWGIMKWRKPDAV